MKRLLKGCDFTVEERAELLRCVRVLCSATEYTRIRWVMTATTDDGFKVEISSHIDGKHL
jgi:hypothetical protein